MAAIARDALGIPDGETLGKMKHRHKMEFKKCLQDGKAMMKDKKISKKEGKDKATQLEKNTKERHAAELAWMEEFMSADVLGDDAKAVASSGDGSGPSSASAAAVGGGSLADPSADNDDMESDAGVASKKSRAKARRDRKKAAKDAVAAEVAAERATIVDTRVIETAAINARLAPYSLAVFDVPADGNCLFRAIEHQLARRRAHAGSAVTGGKASPVPGHREIRRIVAEHIRSRGADFGPFLPYEEEDGYDSDPAGALVRYCDRLGNTSMWGGQPEVRAAAEALKVPVVVVQAEGEAFGIGNGGEAAAA